MKLSPEVAPFDLLGEKTVLALAERFYELMDEKEPALAHLHRLDENGKVCRDSRDRFALFLVGWLGGPQEYMARYGHPRLGMRHAHVPVDSAMRDAWLRCMFAAMKELSLPDAVRGFLEQRFAQVADFLRNVAE